MELVPMSIAANRGSGGGSAAGFAGGASAAGFAPVASVAVTMRSRRVRGARDVYRLECTRGAPVREERLSQGGHDCHNGVTDSGHHISGRRAGAGVGGAGGGRVGKERLTGGGHFSHRGEAASAPPTPARGERGGRRCGGLS